MTEATSDDDAIGRFTEERDTSGLPSSASQARPNSQSQDTLVEPSSPRPRRNARSARRHRYPAISVVIPTHRNDEAVAISKQNRPSKRCRHLVSSENDRETRSPMDDDYSPHPEDPNFVAGYRPPKLRKRAKGDRLSSNAAVVEKCANKTQGSSEDGMAFTLGNTEEIFGRGVLRIQANGPRYAYFMTFLPELSRQPSMPTEAPHKRSPRDEVFPGKSITREGNRRKGCTRSTSPEYEMRDGVPEKMIRGSLSCGRDNQSQKKHRRRLRWSSEEVEYLKELRKDGQRRWSEVTRSFLGRYPGRSSAAIQVYCSTHGL